MDGRRDLELFRGTRARRESFESSSSLFDVVGCDFLREASGRKLGFAHASIGRGLIELGLRYGSLLGESLRLDERAVSLVTVASTRPVGPFA